MNKLKLSSRAKVFKKFGKNLTVVKQNEQKSIKPIQFNYRSTLTKLEKFNIRKQENKNIGLPYHVFDHAIRSKKLANAQCFSCGTLSNVVMHHKRQLKSSVTDNTFKGIIKNLTRKQIPLCRECHLKVHPGLYDGPRIY